MGRAGGRRHLFSIFISSSGLFNPHFPQLFFSPSSPFPIFPLERKIRKIGSQKSRLAASSSSSSEAEVCSSRRQSRVSSPPPPSLFFWVLPSPSFLFPPSPSFESESGAEGRTGGERVRERASNNSPFPSSHTRGEKKSDRNCERKVTPVCGEVKCVEWTRKREKIPFLCARGQPWRNWRGSMLLFQVEEEGRHKSELQVAY